MNGQTRSQSSRLPLWWTSQETSQEVARKLVNRPAKMPGRAWTLQNVGQCGRDRAAVGRAVAAFLGKGPAHQ